MTQWLKRIGRAVGMGLAWAVVWAPIAVVIGTTIVDPDNSMDEMWPAAGAYPGFLCALIFFALLGTIALMSALSAVGSALLARMAKKRQSRDAGAQIA